MMADTPGTLDDKRHAELATRVEALEKGAVSRDSIATMIQEAVAKALADAKPAPTPTPVPAQPALATPIAGIDKLLFAPDLTKPLDFRRGPKGNGTHADYADPTAKGSVTTRYHYHQWGQGPVFVAGNTSNALPDVADKRVEALKLGNALYETGPDGLQLKCIPTPDSLKQWTKMPWSAPVFTWQHSFGVEPPYYAEIEYMYPDADGFWPAPLWWMNSAKYAIVPHDRVRQREIDTVEGASKSMSLTNGMWSYDETLKKLVGPPDASGDWHKRLGVNPRKEFVRIGHFDDGKRVDFFHNGKKFYGAEWPANSAPPQMMYPIISCGVGPGWDEASGKVDPAKIWDWLGFPQMGGSGITRVRSVKVWGAGGTKTFKHNL
jgi:hypothetical protein